MKLIKGGVSTPQGFKSNGLSCGIKKSGKFDLGLVVSDALAVACGTFTKNSIKAAPIVVSQKHLKNKKAQAFIVNSGNANCYTGSFGFTYAKRMAEFVEQNCGIPKDNVVVASTGIIGQPLPIKKIQRGTKRLNENLSRSGSKRFAKAILTTDTKIKECAVELKIGRAKVKLGACAKGSGMVAPNMATMLGFITTDVNISPRLLSKALSQAVNLSFNQITIDGCMSTNDMVVIMANGVSGNKRITNTGKDFDKFYEALHHICLDLAKKIVLDGEGATKFLEIQVNGAKDKTQAKKISLIVANSILVKTAAYGSNPNWGRIAQAVGSLGYKAIDEYNLKINFSSFEQKHITIDIDLGIGKFGATAYTSDLSNKYVKINAEYN